MSTRGKIMVGGAISMAIGIIISIFGYSKFQSIASTIATVADETPPGVVEATIGILIVAIGMFITLHGFGQMDEKRNLQEMQ